MRRTLPLLLLVALAGCGGGGKRSNGSSGSSVTFAANSIVYGVANGTNADYAVDQVAPTGGTPTTVVADVDGGVLVFALDPSQSSRYALAADPSGGGTYGIYLSKSLAPTGATTLVAPAYVAVGSVAATADGTRVVYTGVLEDGSSHLYVVPTAGGTPVDYGAADAAAVAPDGDTVAFTYSQGGPASPSIYLRSLAAGPSGTAQIVVGGDRSAVLPAFSPDGTRLAYWMVDSQYGTDANELQVRTLATGATVTVSGDLDPQGLAFGPDGTTIATVGQIGQSNVIQVGPADGSAAPTTIASSSALLGNYGFFWTDANGRATAGGRNGLGGSRARHRSSRVRSAAQVTGAWTSAQP